MSHLPVLSGQCSMSHSYEAIPHWYCVRPFPPAPNYFSWCLLNCMEKSLDPMVAFYISHFVRRFGIADTTWSIGIDINLLFIHKLFMILIMHKCISTNVCRFFGARSAWIRWMQRCCNCSCVGKSIMIHSSYWGFPFHSICCVCW